MSWRAASLRTGLDLERLYDRPSGYDLDRAFTNVLRLVVRMRTRQVPHRQASTPPGVHHHTSTSRDVSDQAFPSLSNFYCVLRCACGGRPGNEATYGYYIRSLAYTRKKGLVHKTGAAKQRRIDLLSVIVLYVNGLIVEHSGPILSKFCLLSLPIIMMYSIVQSLCSLLRPHACQPSQFFWEYTTILGLLQIYPGFALISRVLGVQVPCRRCACIRT